MTKACVLPNPGGRGRELMKGGGMVAISNAVVDGMVMMMRGWVENEEVR